MKKSIFSIILAFTLLFGTSFLVCAEDDCITYYVSPDGNDQNQGTEDSPLATLKGAKEKIKADGVLKKKKIDVIFSDGYYRFDETVQFNAKDSGSKEFPITYKAQDGAKVYFEGGMTLDPKDAQEVTDPEILSRLSKNAKDKIKVIDLKKYGIMSIPDQIRQDPYITNQYSPMRFYIDDKEVVPARYPNGNEWLQTGKIIDPGTYHDAGRQSFDGIGGTFQYNDDHIENWKTYDDVWMYGQFAVAWAPNSTPIKSVDKKNKTITALYNAAYQYKVNANYYYFNVLEELDTKGEYYADKKMCMLYFYDSGISDKSFLYLTYSEKPFINFEYTKYVRFENIIFQGTRGTALTSSKCRGLSLLGCTIRFIGVQATDFNGGYEYIVDNCLIYETGCGGVYVTSGDENLLLASGTRITNNHIYNFSQWKQTYSSAVSAKGVYELVANNEFHGGNHMSVATQTGTIVEYNDIYDFLNATDDAGVIYNYCDGTAVDINIRYNLIRSSAPNGVLAGTGCWGVYNDGFTSNTRIYGNIFYDLPGGIHVNGGQNNNIYNNLFVNCATDIWAHAFISHGANDFWGKLDRVGYNKGIWRQRYPLLTDFRDNDATKMFKNNIVTNNISSNVYRSQKGAANDERYPNVYENNVTVSPDTFKNLDNLDFTMGDKNPLSEFTETDTNKIGRNKRTAEEIESGLPEYFKIAEAE